MNGIGRFTEKECYQNALNINLDTSDSWFNLGLVLRRDESATVKQCPYSKKECFENAVHTYPQNCEAWCALGKLLSTTNETSIVHGTTFINKTCFTNALVADERHRNAWVSLANLLKKGESVRVGVTHFTKEQCEQTARDLLEDDDS